MPVGLVAATPVGAPGVTKVIPETSVQSETCEVFFARTHAFVALAGTLAAGDVVVRGVAGNHAPAGVVLY